MDREAFNALPPVMQLKVLARVVFDGERLDEIDVGRRPFPPKFDMRIPRSGGFQWASEMDVESLTWWQKRFRESAAKGGQYAQKDAKRAKEIERWLAWRQWEPRTVWRGERFNVAVVAAQPSNKPAVHQYEPRQQSSDAATGNDDEINYGEVDDEASPYG